MKLEEGMYVRLQNDVENVVVINKIANIFDNTILTENDGSIYQGEYTKENIIKASHNIIDLIEEGDYVNGKYIDEIDKNRKLLYSYERDDYYIFKERDINTIVTKEQFEAMKYEVK